MSMKNHETAGIPESAISAELQAAAQANTLLDMESRLRRYIDLHHDLLLAEIRKGRPEGGKPTNDILKQFPHHTPAIIIDAGANVGQSALSFRRIFPAARIYSFEPIAATHSLLQQALANDPLSSCHRLALGAEAKQATMRISANSSTENSVVEDPSRIDEGSPAEGVEVTTLDSFAGTHQLGLIGLLKIDTEGYDLQVLRGADRLLRERKVDFIVVEAGMNPDNTTHVPFAALHEHLVSRDYLLFKIYDQRTAWPTKQPHLRRADLMYIRSELSPRPAQK